MQIKHRTASSRRTIRCILFDLGQTLWERIEKDSIREQEATQRAIQTIRRHVPPEIFARVDLSLLHERFYESVILQMQKFVLSHPWYEPDYGQMINETLPQFGLPELDRPASEAVFEALRIPILGSRRLFDDALSTLSTLKQRGFLLGVVTNRYWGGQPFLADIQKMGLFEYFEPSTLAISADLGIRKPNPDIFWHALRELDATPQESAMVGDSLYADIMGAKELNMLAVWKPKLSEHAGLATSQKDTLQNDDDDSLFSHVLGRDNQQNWRTTSASKPDRTIKHLHELLDIFVEVGRQVEIK